MTIDPLQDRLADYLGDEMTTAERRDFERELAERPELARQAEDFQLVVAAMRERWTRPMVAPHRRATLWRYAAAALLAFSGGFVVRGFYAGNSAAPPAELQTPRGESAMVQAYLDTPAESRFARILMALARRDQPSSEFRLD